MLDWSEEIPQDIANFPSSDTEKKKEFLLYNDQEKVEVITTVEAGQNISETLIDLCSQSEFCVRFSIRKHNFRNSRAYVVARMPVNRKGKRELLVPYAHNLKLYTEKEEEVSQELPEDDRKSNEIQFETPVAITGIKVTPEGILLTTE